MSILKTSQINKQTLYLKKPEKEERAKPKASKNYIKKISAQIHKIHRKINKTKK